MQTCRRTLTMRVLSDDSLSSGIARDRSVSNKMEYVRPIRNVAYRGRGTTV
jgi:hypothetical protein